MSRKPDGNLAFKVTWVYGADGPFTSACTAEGRQTNIVKDKKTWCGHEDCPCRQIFDEGNDANRSPEAWPCYDSAIFDKWSFGAGGYLHGARAGQKIPFPNAKLDKLAFLTSKRTDMAEKDRIVLAGYKIAKIRTDEDFNNMAAIAGSVRWRVKDFNAAPKFWNFYSLAGGPSWGTGLFRYITDDVAEKMMDAVMKVGMRVNGV